MGCPHARVNAEVKSALCFKLIDELFQPIIRIFELAFPNDVATPAGSLQGFNVPLVSINILTKFLGPEFRSRLGSGSIAAAGVAMPKAAMDKNTGFPLWQNNVRAPRKVFSMESEPVSASMKEFADCNLWFRVATGYGTHHSGSGGCIDNVHSLFPSVV